MTAATSNPSLTCNRPLTDLADRARRLADTHPNGSRERCAALVVAVAVREMSTPAKARRLIAEHFAARPRNAGVGTAAVALLEQLTTTEGTTA